MPTNRTTSITILGHVEERIKAASKHGSWVQLSVDEAKEIHRLATKQIELEQNARDFAFEGIRRFLHADE